MTALRVVRGTPDDEELAAVVAALAVVSARPAGQPREDAPGQPTPWRVALRSGPPGRGPDAWRRGR